jgi:hypothetical protein
MTIRNIFIFIFIFIIQASHICAQNLVPDGSFEFNKNWQCSLYNTDSLQWFWTDGNISPKTYRFQYCGCLGNKCTWCVPSNANGFQYPRSGSNYNLLSYIYYGTSTQPTDTGFRDYLEVKLSSPLIKNKIYSCGYFLSLCNEHTKCPTSDFGMYLSDTSIRYPNIEPHALPFKPQIFNPSWRMLNDTQNWMPVSGLYKAHGGEQYIIIGNFADNQHSHSPCAKPSNDAIIIEHYYTDDVFVIGTEYLHRKDSICKGSFAWLHSRFKGVGCLWPDSSRGDSFMVYKPGIYPVVYDSNNFAAVDSIIVSIRDLTPGLHDTVLCTGTGFTLSFPAANTYLWQDGSVSKTMNIVKEGTYWVRASSAGCTYTDTIHVRYNYPNNLRFLPADTSICSGIPWKINADSIDGTVYWQDSIHNKIFNITTRGDYTIKVQNACGINQKKITISEHQCNNCGSVYPNPATDFIHIDYTGLNNNRQLVRLDIYDNQGNFIRQFQTSNIEKADADIGFLCRGIYLFRLYGSDKLFCTGKFEKNP